MTAITQTTLAKADTIRRALPLVRSTDLPLLLAMLTSANNIERTAAKKQVRELAYTGQVALGADRDAEVLRDFANRNEPGQIAP